MGVLSSKLRGGRASEGSERGGLRVRWVAWTGDFAVGWGASCLLGVYRCEEIGGWRVRCWEGLWQARIRAAVCVRAERVRGPWEATVLGGDGCGLYAFSGGGSLRWTMALGYQGKAVGAWDDVERLLGKPGT